MYDQEDKYFDREYFTLYEGKQRYLEGLIDLLRSAQIQSGKVLDIGCGFGFFLEALKQHGYEPSGVDISALAIDQIKKRSQIPVFQQSAESPLPFADDYFQAITCFDVIEHAQDFQALISNSFKKLAPGGQFFMSTLNSASIARFLLGKKWSWYQDPTHIHLFSGSILKDAMQRAGFCSIQVRTFFNFCVVGESTPFLKPLRFLGKLIFVPAFGDCLMLSGAKHKA